MLKINEN